MKNILKSLNNNWKLFYIENSKCKEFSDKITSYKDLEKLNLNSLNATVPGDFISDLFNSKIIPDPLYGTNAWDIQKFEAMHVWYYTEFDYNFEDNEWIEFNGLDTISDIYLDGILSVHTNNMFIPYRIKGNNNSHHELLIHFIPAVIDSRKYKVPVQSNALWYNYQSMFIRKPSYMFGWDILPRIVNCGIWKDVNIIKINDDTINDVYVYTIYVKPEENIAKIRIIFDISVSNDLIQKYKIRFSGQCKDSSFCEEITPWGTQYGRMAFEIQNAKLWWPKGYGDANIYNCKAELLLDGSILDVYHLNIGLRTISLVNTEANIDNNGKFEFLVNNQKVFCKGVNWSPISPYPSKGIERQNEGLDYLNQTNSNIVRIWGGGYYENSDFYDFCDNNGIMVWQDFMMACAVYPQEQSFISNLSKEIEYQICTLRNHPSIVLWSGDNECDCTYNSWAGVIRDPNENIITRKIIPELVHKNDLTRPYLPSSPFISQLCFTNNYSTTEEHLWGPRPPYESSYYKDSKCNFVSEIGFFGAVSEKSALQFIPTDYLYPLVYDNGTINKYWLAHATETMDAYESPYKYRVSKLVNIVKNYFGYVPNNYRDFSILSQIIQAEAVKRFIEIFRSSNNRSGIIYWNLMDGHGNVSEAIVDYYGNKKLAFYYLNKSYSNVLLFINKKDENFNLIVSNTTNCDVILEYQIKSNNNVLTGSFISKANSNDIIQKLDNINEKELYIISYKIDNIDYKSHYIDNIYSLDIQTYIKTLKNNNIIPADFDF